MTRFAIPLVCLVMGIFLGSFLAPEAPIESVEQSQSVKKTKKRNRPSAKGKLGLEGIYAELKEPLILNEEISPLQKAVMIHDIETREAYSRLVEDQEAGMEVELSIQAPLARKVLELHLQGQPDDVAARALLVKYLVFASYKGSGIFEQKDLQRAEKEARIAAQSNSLEARVEMQRLSVELAGFLETCPSPYAENLKNFLGEITRF